MRIRGNGNPPQNSTEEHSASQRYEVLNRHGEGSLFIVYRVRDRASLSIHALKALRGTHAHRQEFLTAWHEVAQAAERRHLPHIASVFESGTEKMTPYLVEEWLPGGSLENRLRRAPFNRVKTVKLAGDMAIALSELHNNGDVHGDLRPRQVLFSESGVLKLDDVGWEYAVRRNGLAAVDTFPDAAYYTAPEIWEGKPVTPASDIYSLGAILYRMLAGRVPFDGTSPIAIGGRHRHTPVMRPSHFNPSCALNLEEIAVGMLSKDPQQRIAPFQQLLALHSGQQGIAPAPATEIKPQEEVANKPQKTKRKKKNQPKTRKELGKKELKGALLAFFWALIAIGMLAGIVSGAVYFWMQSTPSEVLVPDYIGMMRSDAVPLLKQKGLELEIGKEVYDPDQPSDTILDGTPHPGTNVRSGRKIVVTVSRGKEPIRMYDFRDLTLEQAKRIMEKHGLRLGQITNQYDNKIPKDVIITQFPQPGQYARRDDPISLMISRGPFPTTELRPTDREPTTADDNRVTSPADDADNQEDGDTNSVDDSDLLTSENVQIKVNIPDSAAAQLVNIVVDDATGEHTVYSATVRPGSTVDETVRIAKSSRTKATVRVYAGGELLQEMDF